MHRTRISRRLAAGLSGLAAIVALGASPAVGSPLRSLSPTSPDGVALLSSGQATTTSVDPASGAITAVYAGFPPAAVMHDAAATQRWALTQP